MTGRTAQIPKWIARERAAYKLNPTAVAEKAHSSLRLRAKSLGILPLLALSAIGCESGSRAHFEVTRTDSAGVEIVLVPLPDASSEPTSPLPTPEVEIGAVSGDDELLLYYVRGAVRLSDGGIVVAHGSTGELLYFSSTGELIQTVGGKGDGPGEFRAMDLLAVLSGDSLLVLDMGLQRLSLFDPTGLFTASWSLIELEAPPLSPTGGVTRDGRVVLYRWRGDTPEIEGVYNHPVEIGLLDRSEEDYRLVGEIVSSGFAQAKRGDRLLRAFRPFGLMSDVAAGDSVIYALDGIDGSSIKIFSLEGLLIRILRFQGERVTITKAITDQWQEGFLTRYADGSESLRESWRFGWDRIQPPTQVPLFRSIEVDTDGNLCLERYPMTEMDPHVYLCLDQHGEFMRSIAVPPGTSRGGRPNFDQQFEIGADYVLGIWVDDLGVERVRLYRFP